MKIKYIITTLIAAMAMTSSYGGILLSDDFEGNTVGSGNVIGWNEALRTGDNIEVVYTNGSKAVQLVNGEATISTPSINKALSATGSQLRVTVDFMYANNTESPSIYLQNSTGTWLGYAYLAYRSSGNGAGEMRWNNARLSGASALSIDTWYSLAIDVASDDTVSINVTDGGSFDETYTQLLAGGDLAVRDTYTVSEISRLNLRYAGAAIGGEYYVDNVIVSDVIPEPATLGLIAVAGFGVLLLRKIRL